MQDRGLMEKEFVKVENWHQIFFYLELSVTDIIII